MQSACPASAGLHTNPLPDGRASYHLLAERVAGAQRYLDLGCGDGSLLAVLAGQGAKQLAGVNVSEGELSSAHARPELADAALYLGSAEELPFADNTFDAVVSHLALLQMPDVEQVIAEAARVLIPNGRFVASLAARPEPASGYDLFLALMRPHFAATRPEQPLPRFGEACTQDGLSELLTPAGLEVVHWEQVTLGTPGPAEEVWQTAVEKYCDTALLADGELEDLRAEFIARAPRISQDGRIAPGERLSIATTELTNAELNKAEEYIWL
ncbi:methyltransferase domain-containing protein [Nocardia sp. NPDC051832]|uniref:class I SAM-dependent methyltransferase n=1 Tax=Nocardia sp. NPDC051832 TaxID=3155673 RepID=UPI0034283D62